MREIYNYCTLFDSNYLDRGVVMINSLNRVGKNFRIYVLAMDEKCYQILDKKQLPNTVIISQKEFENDEMKRVRESRTLQEYCWTCSSALLEYLLEEAKLSNCTYIDADMFFYSNPNELVEEVINNKCSVGIMEHDFPSNMEGIYARKQSGTYCVEFNTFLNDEKGRTVLEWWKRKCIDSCMAISDGKVFGDQLYLEKWPERFKGVYVHTNRGGGIAPWNIMNYRYDKNGEKIVYKPSGECIKPIFFHFHCLRFENAKCANIGVYTREGKKDNRLVQDLYAEYLEILISERRNIEEKYGHISTFQEIGNSSGKERQTLFERIKKVNIFWILNWILVRKNAAKDRIEIEG